MILRVLGGTQIVIFGLILIGLIIGIVAIFTSRAKHKAKAESLSSVLDSSETRQNAATISADEKLSKLERLNKLKQDGALSEEEFAREKAKILM